LADHPSGTRFERGKIALQLVLRAIYANLLRLENLQCYISILAIQVS